MAEDLIGAGMGGGKKQAAPTRTPDTLISEDYVEVVLGLCEGPIKGIVPGDKPDRLLQNFFLDATALQSASTGLSNFTDFNAEFLNGEDTDGPILNRLGGITSNMSIGVRLSQSDDVIRQTPSSIRGFIDQLEFRILFNQLVLQNDSGTFEATARFTIAYKLSTSPTWLYYRGEPVSTITGKTSNGYVKDFLIQVPRQSAADYDVRVTKVSPDNGTEEVVEITWESLQMTTLGNRTYSNLAVAHLWGKASNQFTSIPEFSGIFDGWIVRVPTNYNPDARTYDESTPWDGSFKLAYTNNNAWCLYAAITNTESGLAKYYRNVSANRYEFYAAGKWCDEMVPNGKGGFQPRFTYNDLMTDLRPGTEALMYMAGSFNSIIFDDGNGTIRLKMDKYQEPDQIFTPENIAGGEFSYSFTDITTRINEVTVSFVNPEMEWGDDRRPATLDVSEWQAANGIIPEEFTAVGCTDVHEALRRANYRLLTANTEVTSVTFSTTRFGVITELYNTIYIADPDAGWSTGGRIKSVVDNVINLRDPIYFANVSPVSITVQTYTGLVKVTVTPYASGIAYSMPITSGTLPSSLPDRTVFTAENTTTMGVAKPFKVLSIESQDGSPDNYQITAIEVNINKYTDADANTVSDDVVYSFRRPGLPLQPYNLTASSGTRQLQVMLDGTLVPRIYVSWVRPPRSYTDHYELDWQEAGTGVWRTETVFADFFYINGVMTGRSYDIQVTAVSILGQKALPTTIEGHVVQGKEEPPPNITGLLITSGAIVWDEILATDVPDLRGYVLRFQYGDNKDWGTATKLHDGYLTTGPFRPSFNLSGTITVLAKALDTSGVESVLPASAMGDLGISILQNIVQQVDLSPSFPGTLENCTLVAGELLADGVDLFYGEDNDPFFKGDSEPFFKSTGGYNQMVYTTPEIIITGAVDNSVATLDLIADGSNVLIEYKEYLSVPFFGPDSDPFFGPDLDPFFKSVGLEWKPWRGQTALHNGSYQWRVTIGSSSIQGRLSVFHLLIDAPDRYEDISNVTISNTGTAVPYTLTGLNSIKTVQTQLHANGVGAVTTRVDKTIPLAPVIFAYNSSNVAVSGATVDITITGF